MKDLTGLRPLSLLTCTLLAGCLASLPVKTAIDMQSWRQLQILPGEKWVGPTTATYTYVLMGNVGDGTAGSDTPPGQAVKVLEKLLSFGVQTGDDPAALSTAQRLEANQYCIPALPQPDPTAQVSLKTYTFPLARSYTNAFMSALDPGAFGAIRQRLSGTGPFLVTTWAPLSDLKRDEAGHIGTTPESAVLLVDLSGVEPVTAVDFVRAQQKAIRDVQPPGSIQVRPFGPMVASFIVKFDAVIPFVASAEASVLKQFTPAKDKKDAKSDKK